MKIDQIDHKQNCQPNCTGNMYILFVLCDQLLLTHPNITAKLLNCVLDTVEERFGV